MTDQIGHPDIILVLPDDVTVVPPPAPVGYHVRPMRDDEDEHWIAIHRKAVPSFSEDNLKMWLKRYRTMMLPDGILVAVETATGNLVATAGSIANDRDGMFPNGGQLAYVATDPAHQKRGLGRWLSALATQRLQQGDFKNVFLITGDDLTDAISIYVKLGYRRHYYASDQFDRWGKICWAIGMKRLGPRLMLSLQCSTTNNGELLVKRVRRIEGGRLALSFCKPIPYDLEGIYRAAWSVYWFQDTQELRDQYMDEKSQVDSFDRINRALIEEYGMTTRVDKATQYQALKPATIQHIKATYTR